jgi:hypothetical protein
MVTFFLQFVYKYSAEGGGATAAVCLAATNLATYRSRYPGTSCVLAAATVTSSGGGMVGAEA